MARQRNAASAGQPGRPFDFADLADVARSRASLIRNIALGFVVLTLAVLLVLPSRYSATANVLLDPRKNAVTGLSAVLSEMPTDPASVQNQIQLLTSRDLAAQVIQRLDLADDPEFNATLSPYYALNPLHWFAGDSVDTPGYAERQYARIIDTFERHLDVDAIGLSTTMSVSFSSLDPQKAARIANAVADAYIESQVEAKSAATRLTTGWLEQRIRQLALQLQNAEENVQRYKAQHAINDTGEGTLSLVDQQLAAINSQLVQARADLAAKRANDARIRTLVGTGNAADVSQVVSSPLIVQLRTQQADAVRNEAELSSRYGPRHPKRIAAEAQLRDLQSKIDQEVTRIGGSVANDVSVAEAQVGSLQSSLDRVESQATGQDVARVKLKALEANADSTRTMYESFVARLRETEGQDAVEIGDSRVISHATVPTLPSSPPRLLLSVVSIPAGLLLGLLCALLMERAQQVAPMQPRPVARSTVPVLAQVPEASVVRAADLVTDRPGSAFAQALRAMARQLATLPDGGPRVIVVTSIDPREGQSNIAVGLARAFAELKQRAVVIDGNLQSPMAAWTMRVPAGAPGILEVLGGTVPLTGSLTKDPRSGALLLTSNQHTADARGTWASRRMSELMAHLRKNCGIVIIDAPQIWAAEMPIVATHADVFLLVTKNSMGPRVEAAIASLLGMRRAPVGVVLSA